MLLFGTGGVGGIYVYILDKGGAEITAVCRSNFEAVKEHGIFIESKVFGNVRTFPKVVRSVGEAEGHWDFVVVCSKAFPGAKPSTAEILKPAVSTSTAIVLCQNGIGLEKEYADMFPGNPIISGVVYLPTTQESPGVISMGNLERLEVGTYPHDAGQEATKAVNEFAKLFRAGGASIEVHEDIQLRRWSKLAVNAAWNPMCALSFCDDASLLRASPDSTQIVKETMYEVVSVARALGYNLTREESDGQFDRAEKRLKSGGKEPSMLTDVRNERPIEVEAILGNTRKIAKGVGIPTPMLDMLYILAKGLDGAILRGRQRLDNP